MEEKDLKRKKINFKRIFIINLCVSLIVILSLLGVILYNHLTPIDPKEELKKYPIEKDALSLIEEGHFDRCIAYFDIGTTFDSGSSMLYDCPLISKEDSQKIKEMDIQYGSRTVAIYLAQKNGEDIVFVVFLEGEKEYLSCKSTYHRSFNEIIEEAESLSQTTLTDDYLNGSIYDPYDHNLKSGLEFFITSSSTSNYNLLLQFFVKDSNDIERCYIFAK